MSRIISRTACLAASLVATTATQALSTTDNTADQGVSRPIGINLAPATDYQTAWSFVDVMRTARPWIPQTSQAPSGTWNTGETLILRPDGYPASLHADQAASTLLCREIEGRYPKGEYSVFYDGNGQIDFDFDARVTSRGDGEITLDVNPTDAGIFLTIKETDPNNPIRNIRVIMPGFEDNYAEQIFHPEFLESLEPFSTIRFMDWGKTNGSNLKSWSTRTLPTFYTQQAKGGVSIEMMIELANRLGADPWICVPHEADDGYVRGLAYLLRNNLDPELTAYVEYSNEIWNSLFKQYDYAAQMGQQAGFASEPWTAAWRWTAHRSIQIFEVMSTILPDDRYVRVLPGQAAVPYVMEQILSWENAGAYADAIAIAPYFDGATIEPSNFPAALDWSVERILDEARADLDIVTRDVQAHQDLAAQYGLDLIGYEGGQHLTPGGTPGFGDRNFSDKLIAVNRHPRMEAIYYDYLDLWHDAGAGPLCLFNHVAEPTQWGNWGLLEYQEQPWGQAPKWTGVVTYLQDNDSYHSGDRPYLNPDLDRDGFATTADIALFVQAFITRETEADFNQDGYLDIGDLNLYIAAYIAENE